MKTRLFVWALIAVWAAGATRPAAADAKPIVQYHFARVIDAEGLADATGTGHTGSLLLDENASFVETPEGPALSFLQESDRVSIPWAAFPGARGRVATKVRFRSVAERQTFWRVYSTKDGMALGLRDKKLFLSYYHRATAKWYRATGGGVTIDPGRWYDVEASWDLSKGLAVFVDGRLAGRAPVSVDPTFALDGAVTLGNSRVGGDQFLRGMVAGFAMYGEPQPWGATGIASGPERAFGADEVERLANEHLDILFSKEYLAPVGATRRADGSPILGDKYRPDELRLWRLTFRDKGGLGDAVTVDSLTPAERSIEVRDAAGGREARLRWRGVQALGDSSGGPGAIDVTVTVRLPHDSKLSTWRIEATRKAGDWRLWQVDFPTLSFAAPDGDGRQCRFLHPYRWGVDQPDPFHLANDKAPRQYDRNFVYPSSNMQMQFYSLYAPGHGTYWATYDGQGYSKQCRYSFDADRLRIGYELSQYPSNEEQQQDEYQLPYDFALGTFEGDWFDAAQLYKTWAVTAPWCQAGPLSSRAGVPDWIKRNHVTLKSKISGPHVAAAIENFLSAFGPPALTMWYSWTEASPDDDTAMPNPERRRDGPYGRLIPAKDGVKETLARLRPKGGRACAYFNSRIFDQGLPPLDPKAREMLSALVVDANGEPITYNKTSIPCWSVNQSKKVWQDQVAAFSDYCVGELGFSGMYLDSFGRGGSRGFDALTSAPVGRGNDLIMGSRELAERVREAIRRRDPESIIASEASIECFVDLVESRLMHENVMTNGRPLYMAVYHEYQTFYGRTFGGSNATRFRENLANLFVVGAQFGRFFGSCPFPDSQKANLEYLTQLMRLRQDCDDFFNLGTMLRPARLDPEPAIIARDLQIGPNHERYSLPEVLTSSWRAPDGRAAVVVANVLEEERTVTVSFDLAEYGFRTGGTVSGLLRFAERSEDLGDIEVGPVVRRMTLAPRQAVVLEFSRK